MMWTTCFGGEAPPRRDRVDERDRPLERDLLVGAEHADLLAQLAHERLRRGSPRLHAAAGKQPVLLVRLLLADRAGSGRASAGSPRRGSGARRHQPLDDPKPRTPRSLCGQLVHLDAARRAATGITTSCAIRMPGSTTNGAARSVLSSTTRSSPR